MRCPTLGWCAPIAQLEAMRLLGGVGKPGELVEHVVGFNYIRIRSVILFVVLL